MVFGAEIWCSCDAGGADENEAHVVPDAGALWPRPRVSFFLVLSFRQNIPPPPPRKKKGLFGEKSGNQKKEPPNNGRTSVVRLQFQTAVLYCCSGRVEKHLKYIVYGQKVKIAPPPPPCITLRGCSPPLHLCYIRSTGYIYIFIIFMVVKNTGNSSVSHRFMYVCMCNQFFLVEFGLLFLLSAEKS